MKNRWLLILLAALCVMLLAGCSSEPDTSPALFSYTINSDNSANISGFSGAEKTIKIPSVIDGHKIVKIGDSAFSGNKTLEQVILPDTVTAIGRCSFENCINLKKVTIPKNVLSIEYRAFIYCEKLETVDLPSGLQTIGDGAFFACKNLQRIALPDSVTAIGRNCFYACSSLKTVTLSKALTEIPEEAFEDCGSLESISIPDSVKTIGDKAFMACRSLKQVLIPNSVEKIEGNPFPGAEVTVLLPDSGSHFYLNNGVLFDRTTLISYPYHTEPDERYEVPDGIAVIGKDAFKLTRVQAVILPDSVTVIENSAFSACRMTSINIPDSIQVIGDFAFSSCTYLERVDLSKCGSVQIGDRSKWITKTYAFDDRYTTLVLKKGSSLDQIFKKEQYAKVEYAD